jgi:transcriptional regulator with XRE-family HTH domain
VSKPARKAIPALQEYLDKHAISQKEFGDMFGVSQGLVWQWLNGATSITPEKAKEIEAETGIPRMRLLYPDEVRAVK